MEIICYYNSDDDKYWVLQAPQNIYSVYVSGNIIPGNSTDIYYSGAGLLKEDSMLKFKQLSTNYEQVVPNVWRNPSQAWQRFSDGNPWPETARTSTTCIGTNGSSGVN
jgi:hypothetical protein